MKKSFVISSVGTALVALMGIAYLASITHITGFARISVAIGNDPIQESIDPMQLAPLGGNNSPPAVFHGGKRP